MDGQWGRGLRRPGRARSWWVFLTVVVVLVFAVGIAVVSTALKRTDSSSAGSASSPLTSRQPTQAPIAADLLLSAEDVSAVMKTSMVDEGLTADLPATGVTVNPAECTGAFDPFDDLTMAQVSPRYTTIADQNLVDRTRQDEHLAQGASIFASAADAQHFFARQTHDWNACARHQLTAFFPRADKTQHHILGVPRVDGDLITLTFGDDRRQCQRALGVKADVIVDVRACGPTIDAEGATVATDILAKIP
ncbi:MAG: sensor domain-containing protein [Mycobacterium sp.]